MGRQSGLLLLVRPTRRPGHNAKCSRPGCRCRIARPAIRLRWSSRMVATPSEKLPELTSSQSKPPPPRAHGLASRPGCGILSSKTPGLARSSISNPQLATRENICGAAKGVLTVPLATCGKNLWRTESKNNRRTKCTDFARIEPSVSSCVLF